MCKDLFSYDGIERLKEIYNMDRIEIDDLCRFSKSCKKCPLAISYRDKNGIERFLCVDSASQKRTLTILENKGKFLRKGDL